MAFVIKYHRLFEVRIFHSFHLRDEVAFYNMTDEDKANELIMTNYNILNDLEIVPTDSCQKLLSGYRLRFKASSIGFVVGVETEQSVDVASQLKPLISIEEDTVFNFRIKIKNTSWTNFTNMRLTPSMKGKFHFNNFDYLDKKQFPSFTLTPAPHQSNRSYEMGEIVSNANNIYKSKIKTDGTVPVNNTAIWDNITANFNNYVSYQDRQLLPSKINYQIIPNSGSDIQNINFDLIRPDNSVAQSIPLTGTETIEQVKLDYSEEPAGIYTLDVISTDGYEDAKPVLIDDDLYDPYDWASVSIAHKLNLGDFRILEPNGDLRVEGVETKHPVFEIRIQSRQTYWKYVLHATNAAYAPPANDPDFEKISGQIFTKTPQPLSRFYVEKTLPVSNKKMPNPSDLLVRTDEVAEKYLSEIRLPKMDI